MSWYWIANKLGWRRFIRYDGKRCWRWRPWMWPGTYTETCWGWRIDGYRPE